MSLSHEVHQVYLFMCIEVGASLVDDDGLPDSRVDLVLFSGQKLHLYTCSAAPASRQVVVDGGPAAVRYVLPDAFSQGPRGRSHILAPTGQASEVIS